MDYTRYLPSAIGKIENHQTGLPRIAKDPRLTSAVEDALRAVPTRHDLYLGDARRMTQLKPQSVQLVVTSPPYWTLKEYRKSEGQLGYIEDYETFLAELDRVWEQCYRALVPGGRLVCVVGDVCLARRRNQGRHTVVPLHASIQEHCRRIGFDNLAPIIWSKISNAAHEAEGNGSGFLGKPFEPNAIIKNDIEFVLMERKPGGYRSPSVPVRVLSVISADNHAKWFRQIWSDIAGTSTKDHPAPFSVTLAERLVRMFSFVGDTVLDPFMGTGSTNLAAARWGRNSIGCEIDPHYFQNAFRRMKQETMDLFSRTTVVEHGQTSGFVGDREHEAKA